MSLPRLMRAAGRQLHPPGRDQGGPGRAPLPRPKWLSSGSARSPGWATSCRTPGIKIDSVASSIAIKSGRAMIEALIDGERRGKVLADLARGKMRAKIPDLSMALEGRFGDHHALMCRLHMDHIDHLEAMLARLDAQVEAMMEPFHAARDLLTTAPSIGPLSAAAVISEIGADVREFFPDDARLASWTCAARLLDLAWSDFPAGIIAE